MDTKINAIWKQKYQEMFENTPKNKRRTKKQILGIISKSKLFTSLYIINN